MRAPSIGAVALAAMGVGLLLVVWVTWPAKPAPILPAPEVRLPEGGLRLEVKPDAKAKPKRPIPAGVKLDGLIGLTIKPSAAPILIDGNPACPPVRVDLSLITLADHSQRVDAYSPDGEVVAGLHIPIRSASGPAPTPWAAGLSYEPFKQLAGAWVERDLGRVRLGAEVKQSQARYGGPMGVETWVRVGATF